MDLSEQHSKSSQGENACNLLLSFFFYLKKIPFAYSFTYSSFQVTLSYHTMLNFQSSFPPLLSSQSRSL